MTHNLNPPQASQFQLSGLAVVRVEGPDAVRFLHAQTMNDVVGLPVMDWQWNGWLNPQGRLMALFALAKLTAESVVLLTPAAGAQALVDGLKRYVFRSKLSLFVSDEETVTARRAPGEPGTRVQDHGESGIELAWPGEYRSVRVMPKDVTTPEDATLEAQWWHRDLAIGIPWLGADLEPRWTPQQLGLDRLNAFSVKKGCYPGQEIVARTHFLGKGKRASAHVQLASSPQSDEPSEIWRLDQDALCVLPMEPEAHPAHLFGVPFRVVPFEQA